ncbi:MAG TPA: substrate-binding domain-containing protein [Burkholderiales bacterium]|nr:substrate-binding domain-containing protein [Burkholderiales bacterium]
MIKIQIEANWRIGTSETELADPLLFRLLEAVQTFGSLAKAAQALGFSYRHIWGSLGKWEKAVGRPLVRLERGRGARLTDFGEKLIRAEQTARSRLERQIETVQRDLEHELSAELLRGTTVLVMHASHDLALPHLRDLLQKVYGIQLQLQYQGSLESLDALAQGRCDVAGFHLPEGGLETDFFLHRRAFKARDHTLVRCATRTQGLLVAAGNPKAIRGLLDLTKRDVRMINRQPNSGTRLELDQLLREAQIDPASISGYDTFEFTHLAVAATIASGMCDVGFGIQAAAAQYKLGFIPLLRERYYLACRSEIVSAQPLKALIATLKSQEFAMLAGQLAGYDWTGVGESLDAESVLGVRNGTGGRFLRPEAKTTRSR